MKDNRYKALKSLIETNGIEYLRDAFEYIPITIASKDLKMHYNTLRRRIDRIELLTIDDILSLANLFQVDSALIFKLALNQIKRKNIKYKK